MTSSRIVQLNSWRFMSAGESEEVQPCDMKNVISKLLFMCVCVCVLRCECVHLCETVSECVCPIKISIHCLSLPNGEITRHLVWTSLNIYNVP